MFQPGRQKTGGRVTGVRNKRTLLLEHLKLNGFDLAREAILLYQRLDDKDRVPLMVKMLDIAFPKIADITVAEAQRILEDDLADKGFDVGRAIDLPIESVEGRADSED